jgi:hypothetical protein
MTEADWKSWLQTEKDAAIFLLYEENMPVGITGVAVESHD